MLNRLHGTETAGAEIPGAALHPCLSQQEGLTGPQCWAEGTLLMDCRCDTATAPEGQQTQPQPCPGTPEPEEDGAGRNLLTCTQPDALELIQCHRFISIPIFIWKMLDTGTACSC